MELDIKDRKKRFKDFFSWMKYLLDFLEDEQLIEQNALSKDKIRQFTDITSPELVPTYLFSWQEFCDVYVRNAEANGVPNLAITATKIQSLAVPANSVECRRLSSTE